MKEGFDRSKLIAHVFAAFPMAKAADAFALSKTGTVVGKVAVNVAAAVMTEQ